MKTLSAVFGIQDRFLTVLLYLSPPPERGGRTSFPEVSCRNMCRVWWWQYAHVVQARRCQPHLGAAPELHPPQGSALAFYSMLPDGNFDAASKHAALPVEIGGPEKWIANVWVWDCSVHQDFYQSASGSHSFWQHPGRRCTGYCPPPCIRRARRCSSRESCSRGWCDA